MRRHILGAALTAAAFSLSAPCCAQTQPPLEPAPPQFEQQWTGFKGPDTYITASDSWKLASTYLSPVSSQPVVMLLHALGRTKYDWRPFSVGLANNGYGYIALDLRGHGGSCLDVSGSTTSWKNFRRTGTDNEFNQMTRDLEAALSFLAARGVPESSVVLLGQGLGANLAAKFAAIHPDIAMAALITPTLNANRDVLTVNPMRVYGKRPLLIITAVEDQRVYKEALIMRSIAQMSVGPGKLTFVTVQKGPSWKIINRQVGDLILQWLKTPELPPVTGVPAVSTETAAGAEPDEPVVDDEAPSPEPGDDGEPVPEELQFTEN